MPQRGFLFSNKLFWLVVWFQTPRCVYCCCCFFSPPTIWIQLHLLRKSARAALPRARFWGGCHRRNVTWFIMDEADMKTHFKRKRLCVCTCFSGQLLLQTSPPSSPNHPSRRIYVTFKSCCGKHTDGRKQGVRWLQNVRDKRNKPQLHGYSSPLMQTSVKVEVEFLGRWGTTTADVSRWKVAVSSDWLWPGEQMLLLEEPIREEKIN